jgi:[ribosomal protein S18]-alanine N-acetyltransferase
MAKIELAICKDVKLIQYINKISLPISYSIRDYIEFIISHGSNVFKALHNNSIVGYVLIKKYSNNRMHIMSFAVHPDYRRLKIGSSLMKKAHDFSIDNNFSYLTLYVQCTNTKAIAFYLAFGFIIKKTLKNYYKFNDHAYIMEYSLKKINL